ncbi:aminotransferase class I/II-fold pyridoxal phosphate-dependent enzyme [Alkalicoccus luteus]|uniref:Aminotransferase class I/II-fold pyridoxal phosphate-dependent enzyme n=1 Tax=Alkalicoccus luteus TaxID=1237094 RepID=A0A969PW61_9BACI|nr:aminotransferase class I/II-fold pyridoxal phosphate-dependent enzyme [Alkalicoccus luteus]NJP39003.1 aminotransferase class I/II-fold pyridoxal phosphate-dependent enzyme [Alkalicoccus luteus]
MTQMPLVEALLSRRRDHSFHVPGHKNGALLPAGTEGIFETVMQIDKTEITGLDDLHDATGVIREAEILLSRLYKSRNSRFLIGGSTSGILAAVLSSVSRGETVLVQRNCHQSVFHALELAGAEAVLIEPDKEARTGAALGIPAGALETALAKVPEAVAVMITNPSYEGYAQQLHAHAALCQKYGALFIVDEAHGAHFLPGAEHPFFESAVEQGADLVIQSAHKMLPALTMGAWIHICSSRVDESALNRMLQMIQSSSPSYPIMASLDAARAFLADVKEWDKIAAAAHAFCRQAGAPLLPVQLGQWRLDPLKAVFAASDQTSTFAMERRLEAANAFAELRTPELLVLTLPLHAGLIQRMIEKLPVLSEGPLDASVFQHAEPEIRLRRPALLQEEMGKLVVESCPIYEASGKISAADLIPYPPGVPLLIRGEQITDQHIEKLLQLREAGIRIKGDEEHFRVFTTEKRKG